MRDDRSPIPHSVIPPAPGDCSRVRSGRCAGSSDRAERNSRSWTQTINTIQLKVLVVMAKTTIPVKPETLARLRSYKVGGATYDDVLNDFMDERPPRGFRS